MRIVLIAAIAKNRIIGNDGLVPWDIPEDRRRFRRLTEGYAVLMGRHTFRSLRRPLPLRRNVVLSHDTLKGIESYASLETAFERLQDEPLVFVIGGGEVYRQTIDRADAMQLTLIDKAFPGDVEFPSYEKHVGTTWKETYRERGMWWDFVDYERIARAVPA